MSTDAITDPRCDGRPRFGRARRLVLIGTAVVMVPVLSLLTGALWPDALDRLDERERAAVEPAIQGSLVCGLPLARVRRVEVRSGELGAPLELHYQCGWTPFAIPRYDELAECGSDGWIVPGYFESRDAGGNCRPWR